MSATYRIGEFDISKAKFAVAPQTYVGENIAVIPSAKDIAITPAKGAPAITAGEYTILSFEKNTKAGTAVMYVQGNGRYCGIKKVTFKITKAPARK